MDPVADYTDLRPHGPGAPGTSYLASPPARVAVQGPVVLRVLDLGREPAAPDPAAEELQRHAAVDSPHLARLLDAGHQGGRLFSAVERLPRGTLARPVGELERAGILKVVADAARGAHALHEAGIAHGSISPDVIGLHDEGGRLAPPGLDRHADPGRTVASGTPVPAVECADPAVIRGDQPSRSSDVWSLGLTLHRALSGCSAYGEELADANLEGAVRRILTSRPRPAPAVDPDVAAVVTACVALDPDDRPLTAEAVAEWLEELLASPPATGSGPSWPAGPGR